MEGGGGEKDVEGGDKGGGEDDEDELQGQEGERSREVRAREVASSLLGQGAAPGGSHHRSRGAGEEEE